MYCYVGGCPNADTFSKDGKKRPIVQIFISAPKDEELFQEWQKAIPINNNVFSKSDKLCALHFNKSEVILFTETKLANGNVRRLPAAEPRLCPGTVPSIFPKQEVTSIHTKNQHEKQGIKRKASSIDDSDSDVLSDTENSKQRLTGESDDEDSEQHMENNISATSFGSMRDRRSNKMCSVPNCTNRAGGNISMHQFPKNLVYRRKWIDILGMQKDTSKAAICSDHFTTDDFFYQSPLTRRRRLRSNAVPVPQAYETRVYENQNILEPHEKRRKTAKIESVLRTAEIMESEPAKLSELVMAIDGASSDLSASNTGPIRIVPLEKLLENKPGNASRKSKGNSRSSTPVSGRQSRKPWIESFTPTALNNPRVSSRISNKIKEGKMPKYLHGSKTKVIGEIDEAKPPIEELDRNMENASYLEEIDMFDEDNVTIKTEDDEDSKYDLIGLTSGGFTSENENLISEESSGDSGGHPRITEVISLLEGSTSPYDSSDDSPISQCLHKEFKPADKTEVTGANEPAKETISSSEKTTINVVGERDIEKEIERITGGSEPSETNAPISEKTPDNDIEREMEKITGASDGPGETNTSTTEKTPQNDNEREMGKSTEASDGPGETNTSTYERTTNDIEGEMKENASGGPEFTNISTSEKTPEAASIETEKITGVSSRPEEANISDANTSENNTEKQIEKSLVAGGPEETNISISDNTSENDIQREIEKNASEPEEKNTSAKTTENDKENKTENISGASEPPEGTNISAKTTETDVDKTEKSGSEPEETNSSAKTTENDLEQETEKISGASEPLEETNTSVKTTENDIEQETEKVSGASEPPEETNTSVKTTENYIEQETEKGTSEPEEKNTSQKPSENDEEKIIVASEFEEKNSSEKTAENDIEKEIEKITGAGASKTEEKNDSISENTIENYIEKEIEKITSACKSGESNITSENPTEYDIEKEIERITGEFNEPTENTSENIADIDIEKEMERITGTSVSEEANISTSENVRDNDIENEIEKVIEEPLPKKRRGRPPSKKKPQAKTPKATKASKKPLPAIEVRKTPDSDTASLTNEKIIEDILEITSDPEDPEWIPEGLDASDDNDTDPDMELEESLSKEDEKEKNKENLTSKKQKKIIQKIMRTAKPKHPQPSVKTKSADDSSDLYCNDGAQKPLIFSSDTIHQILKHIKLPLTSPVTFRIGKKTTGDSMQGKILPYDKKTLAANPSLRKIAPRGVLNDGPSSENAVAPIGPDTPTRVNRNRTFMSFERQKRCEALLALKMFEGLGKIKKTLNFETVVNSMKDEIQYKKMCYILKECLREVRDSRNAKTNIGKLTIRVRRKNKRSGVAPKYKDQTLETQNLSDSPNKSSNSNDIPLESHTPNDSASNENSNTDKYPEVEVETLECMTVDSTVEDSYEFTMETDQEV